MHETSEKRIMANLRPDDVVLDIGGWARPFNRADYVIDAEPYDTRGYYGTPQGGEREYFNAETWIRRDVCDHTPFPFHDKELDLVICSQTLEDVRDPIWVCSEMVRVGKRGYLEVPSRIVESCRGVEPGQVGWSHHRWLIDIQNNVVSFLFKYHMLHSHWRFSFSTRFLRRLTEFEKVQWLIWEESFEYHEKTIHGVENIAHELESFVNNVHPYPAWILRLNAGWRFLRGAQRRAKGKIRRSWERR